VTVGKPQAAWYSHTNSSDHVSWRQCCEKYQWHVCGCGEMAGSVCVCVCEEILLKLGGVYKCCVSD